MSVSPIELVRFDGRLGRQTRTVFLRSMALPRHVAPRVSILIPVYNETNYTFECIGSFWGRNRR